MQMLVFFKFGYNISKNKHFIKVLTILSVLIAELRTLNHLKKQLTPFVALLYPLLST